MSSIIKKSLLLVLLSLCCATASAAEISRESLNKMLGIKLFSAGDTWSKKALEKRLGITLVGNDKRFAHRFTRPVAGAQPIEIEVHTDQSNDRITLISFTFANQGDTKNKHKSVITKTGRNITEKLTATCGTKRSGSFSDGVFKIKGDTWQTKHAKFILEVDKGDFVLFHILPPSGMKNANVSGRRDFSKNVKRNDFGDVYIPNVPMVDQGPKGYCVPATMTRIFLYFGIHADMHHLAKAGETDVDNGTSVYRMLKDIKNLRKKANLKMKEFSEVSVKDVKRHIDKGLPVMWCMYSTRALQEVYTFSKLNRKKASSPEEWKRILKKVSVNNSTDGPHALLIIGYNEKTDEIAVTNSWGQQYIAPQWIPAKVAKKVSQKSLLVFEP